ncbi:hypothetical protein BVX98_02645 [bacterium F11]|nr:hypothetical protein BVX98_02645 [bacterium F11]
MICQLRGNCCETHFEKDCLRVVIDVHGVGYEVFMPKSSQGHLREGHVYTVFISESVTAFDGATTLYGFSSQEEKDFFKRIRENVGGMGPKKTLECLDKINKSLPDFKRAIIDQDTRILVSVFGFTKKTAEKLVLSLKGKIDSWIVSGTPKWVDAIQSSDVSDALSGLINLGYREDEAREMVTESKKKLGVKAGTEAILQEALRLLGTRIGS